MIISVGNCADLCIILIYLISVLSISIYHLSGSQSLRKYLFSYDNSGSLTGTMIFPASVFPLYLLYGYLIIVFRPVSPLGLLTAGVIVLSLVIKLKNYQPGNNYPLGGKSDRSILLSVSSVFLVLLNLIEIALVLYIACGVFSSLLGWNIFTSATATLLLTGIYTIVGGMTIVRKTQLVQLLLFIVAFAVFASGHNYSFSENIFRLPSQNSVHFMIMTFLSVSILLFSCYISMRLFSNIKTSEFILRHNRSNTAIGFVLCLAVISGIFLFVYKGPVIFHNESHIHTAAKHFPGINGLIVSGILSVIMGSLSNLFSETSSLLTIQFFGNGPESGQVLACRLTTTILVIFSILAVPLLQPATSFNMLKILYLPLLCAPAVASVYIASYYLKQVVRNTVLISSSIAAAVIIYIYIMYILPGPDITSSDEYHTALYAGLPVFLFIFMLLLYFITDKLVRYFQCKYSNKKSAVTI